jgi:hypothetical protein
MQDFSFFIVHQYHSSGSSLRIARLYSDFHLVSGIPLMLQVSPDASVLAGSCAEALWFISINPVTSIVIKTQT